MLKIIWQEDCVSQVQAWPAGQQVECAMKKPTNQPTRAPTLLYLPKVVYHDITIRTRNPIHYPPQSLYTAGSSVDNSKPKPGFTAAAISTGNSREVESSQLHGSAWRIPFYKMDEVASYHRAGRALNAATLRQRRISGSLLHFWELQIFISARITAR